MNDLNTTKGVRNVETKRKIVPLVTSAAPAEESGVTGNFIKIRGSHFSSGGTLALERADEISDGALRLCRGATEGEFLSRVYAAAPFNDLVLSWNSDTPPQTHVEVFARVYIPDYDGWTDSSGEVNDGWTDWITWGKWSPFIRRECPYCADTHERKDSETQDGRVFAYSMDGGGDSSLNVRGGLTATKLQIMARLRADRADSRRPVLRLLAASFKNTNDPDWQQQCAPSVQRVYEKPAVKLDTPAISQMTRDPEYGNVICSSTCIAMMLGGQGEDVLPEDVSLMNYDFGFGGNGNWSFSAAAAGAFGYESYVHYGSFECIRQQLSSGCAVGLSVKYSNTPDGKYPYLENAPTTTGGHLITIVGYYFSDALGEYVYYSNDPAARPDEKAAFREYRESQLSQAWYRRAMYVVRGKEENAGQWSRVRESGKMLPVSGRENIFALVTDSGETVKLPYNFLFGKRRTFGFRGNILLAAEGDEKSLPDGVRRVSANKVFHYDKAFPTDDGFVEISEGVMDRIFDRGSTATLYVVSNDGYFYSFLAARENENYRARGAKSAALSGVLPAAAIGAAAVMGAAAAAAVTLALGRRRK